MSDSHIKSEYPLSAITDRILAAAIQVHRGLGPGFEEVIYQRALALELQAQGLEFSREVWIDVHYRDVNVGKKRVDFIVEGAMVEIKTCAQLEDVHYIQALSITETLKNPCAGRVQWFQVFSVPQ